MKYLLAQTINAAGVVSPWKKLLRNTGAPMYVLSGTHSTMFPWAAPANVPVEVLIKMGSQLLNIVDKTASSGKMFPSYSNQFSPTSSTADEEEWNMKYPSIIL